MRYLFGVLALLLSSTAYAGVEIRDEANVLSPEQETTLKNTSWKFELHVLTKVASSRSVLDQAVVNWMDAPNVVTIGIDPVNRYTTTHFGVGTGVRSSDFELVARSGNGNFKNGDWAGGIMTIASKAVQMSATSTLPATSVVIQHPTTVVKEESSWWPWILGLGGFSVLAFFLVRFVRRMNSKIDSDMSEFREEASTYRTRNIEEQGWHDSFKKSQLEAKRDATPITAVERPPVVVTTGRATSTKPNISNPPKPRTPPPRKVVVEEHHHHGSGDVDPIVAMEIGRISGRLENPAPRPVESSSRPHSTYNSGGSSSSYDNDRDRSSWGSSSSSSDSGGWGGSFGGGGFDGGGGGGAF